VPGAAGVAGAEAGRGEDSAAGEDPMAAGCEEEDLTAGADETVSNGGEKDRPRPAPPLADGNSGKGTGEGNFPGVLVPPLFPEVSTAEPDSGGTAGVGEGAMEKAPGVAFCSSFHDRWEAEEVEPESQPPIPNNSFISWTGLGGEAGGEAGGSVCNPAPGEREGALSAASGTDGSVLTETGAGEATGDADAESSAPPEATDAGEEDSAPFPAEPGQRSTGGMSGVLLVETGVGMSPAKRESTTAPRGSEAAAGEGKDEGGVSSNRSSREEVPPNPLPPPGEEPFASGGGGEERNAGPVRPGGGSPSVRICRRR